MTSNGTLPPDFDVRTPSPARMYNFFLGGKDNFEADRKAAKKALSVVPYGRQVAWSNRRFLLRAVKYLADQGVDQFIDLGAGIPTQPYVHDVAQTIGVFRDRVSGGSHVAISHITSEGTAPHVISTIQEAYADASAPAVFRSRSEIEGLLTGLEIASPGLVEVSDWRRSHRGSAHPPALGSSRALAGSCEAYLCIYSSGPFTFTGVAPSRRSV
jgi:hypothetical protein